MIITIISGFLIAVRLSDIVSELSSGHGKAGALINGRGVEAAALMAAE